MADISFLGGGRGGYFNSRLGNKFKDYITSDSNDFLPIDNTLKTDSRSFTHRYIQNRNTNTNGKHLADLCMINNLKILNGRKISDLVGKYTWILTLNVEKTKTVIFNKAGATFRKNRYSIEVKT